MNGLEQFWASLLDVARVIVERVVTLLPSLIGAVLLLIAGWLLARFLRTLTVRGMQVLETLFGRFAGPAGVERASLGRSAGVLGAIVFWIVLLFFITAATQVIGLQTFTQWLSRLIEYLPTLAAGLLIIAAGYVLSGFVGDLVQATATRLANAQRVALGRMAQAATLLTAVLVGADQIGIKVTWLALLTALVVASLLGGVMLAASLGARGYVANLIGAHYLRQGFQVGQRVRVAGFDGRILDFTPTSLVLETREGRVALPGSIYHNEPILLVTRTDDG